MEAGCWTAIGQHHHRNALGLIREAREFRKQVCTGHPLDSVRCLDMALQREGRRIVQSGGLNIDNPGQHICIAIRDTRATARAETSDGRARGVEFSNLALNQCEFAFSKGRPRDGRCARAFSAICTMA